MNKLMIASALLVVSSPLLAEWEDAWRNPDLNTSDSAYTGAVVASQNLPMSTSLDQISVHNPDLYVGTGDSGLMMPSSFNGPTSLDVFVAGNDDNYSGRPDLGIVIDDRGEMVGQSR